MSKMVLNITVITKMPPIVPDFVTNVSKKHKYHQQICSANNELSVL